MPISMHDMHLMEVLISALVIMFLLSDGFSENVARLGN